MASDSEISALLEDTLQRPLKAARLPKPEGPSAGNVFKQWAGSQVAAYRFGLVLCYLGTIYFGISAVVAGIPAFEFTTPNGWTPIWASVLILGGFSAAIGAIRAGEEPVTREVRVFNRIELGGAIALFLTLGGYAAVLHILGYQFGDTNRVAAGAGFLALSLQPAVRMIWLFFRPSKSSSTSTGAIPTISTPPAPVEGE